MYAKPQRIKRVRQQRWKPSPVAPFVRRREERNEERILAKLNAFLESEKRAETLAGDQP